MKRKSDWAEKRADKFYGKLQDDDDLHRWFSKELRAAERDARIANLTEAAALLVSKSTPYSAAEIATLKVKLQERDARIAKLENALKAIVHYTNLSDEPVITEIANDALKP